MLLLAYEGVDLSVHIFYLFIRLQLEILFRRSRFQMSWSLEDTKDVKFMCSALVHWGGVTWYKHSGRQQLNAE